MELLSQSHPAELLHKAYEWANNSTKSMSPIIQWKKMNTYESRLNESKHKREQYPCRIPVIVLPYTDEQERLDRQKFLVPQELTAGQFMYVLRQRMKLHESKAMFVFVCDEDGSILAPTSAQMSTLFSEHCSNDGFLYLTYAMENTFGC